MLSIFKGGHIGRVLREVGREKWIVGKTMFLYIHV